MSTEQRSNPIEKLSTVTLVVGDQTAATEWYRDTLGFVVRADEPFELDGRSGRWITVSPPGNDDVRIALVEPDEDLYDPEMRSRLEELRGTDPMWTFTTADIDAAVDDLRGRGVDVDEEITQVPWGRFTTFRDPDGNALQLHEPAKQPV